MEKEVLEAIGNLAMRQHELALEERDIAARQKTIKRMANKLTALAYINLFLAAASIAAIWMR